MLRARIGDQLELEMGLSLDNGPGSGGISNAGELDNYPVIPLLRNGWFRHTELVYTVPDNLESLIYCLVGIQSGCSLYRVGEIHTSLQVKTKPYGPFLLLVQIAVLLDEGLSTFILEILEYRHEVRVVRFRLYACLGPVPLF